MKLLQFGPDFCVVYIVLLLPDVFLNWVAAVVSSPYSDRQRPLFRLTFEVFYNTTDQRRSAAAANGLTGAPGAAAADEGDYVVSNKCGEHYAQHLLTNFVTLNARIGALCRDDVQVKIDTRAVVYIMRKAVKVETNVTLSLPRPGTSDGKMSVIACSETLNSTLQNVALLDRWLQANETHGRSHMISFIEGTNECSPVAMNPVRFQLSNSIWMCDPDYLYNKDRWECCRGDANNRLSTTSHNGWATISKHQRPTTPSSSAVYLTASSQLDGRRASYSFPASVFPATSAHEATTELDSPQPKYWGIEHLADISRIHLVEGDRVFELPLRLWYNDSVICQDEPDCEISLAVSVKANEDHPELRCRRTGQDIPQVAFIQPRLIPWSSEENFCHLRFPPNQTTIERTHLLLKAVVDHKYDGKQTRSLRLSLVKKTKSAKSRETREMLFEIPVVIADLDKKATCQSINDPHITTFDGVEYDNFYEGEFILYQHETLPFKVHAIYQKCQPSLPASCNCGVAIQSGDDVVVIDRCFRRRLPVPDFRNRWSPESGSAMKIQMYLNGNLTLGTKIHEDADGKKYFIYLPHGAYVKVITSGQLINLWIVPSPNDKYMTRGLCGTYDSIRTNDFHLRNGTVLEDQEEVNVTDSGRPQPAAFINEWSVELGSEESLFKGVASALNPYEPKKYCICNDDKEDEAFCDFAADINRCDIYQGRDVTSWLVSHAITNTPSRHPRRRFLRDINDNSVLTESKDEPIIIDKQFVPPPKYKWSKSWNDVIATNFCRNHIKDKYIVGQLCSQIPPVNFKQEITTCVQDIKITGNTTWADSARDAMKEQCIEEVQKNGSLPMDIVQRISNEMCINDCSGHGSCRNGTCHCNADYGSADCSTLLRAPPNVNEMHLYGLCDIRYMSCSRVIVYGQNFIDSINLTCHLQKCKMVDRTYQPLDGIVTERATFLNFNAVECPIPSIHVYMIRISNNGINMSETLLFIPFDSVCNSCNVFNTTCTKKRNSCIIDGRCYSEDEVSPTDKCLVCKSYDDEFQWKTVTDESCYHAWWEIFHLPDWAVALGAAICGSLIGVLTGFLLYRCCCRSQKLSEDDDIAADDRIDVGDCSGFEIDSFLHRSQRIPTFNGDPFGDIDPFDQEVQRPTTVFYNDGKGVENGVDSNTYF